VAADRSPRLGRLVENARRLSRPPPAGMGAVPAARSSPMVVRRRSVGADRAAGRAVHGYRHAAAAPRRPLAHRAGRPDALVALQARCWMRRPRSSSRGGLLVYATCSLEPEENEMQVSAFLDRHTDFAQSGRRRRGHACARRWHAARAAARARLGRRLRARLRRQDEVGCWVIRCAAGSREAVAVEAGVRRERRPPVGCGGWFAGAGARWRPLLIALPLAILVPFAIGYLLAVFVLFVPDLIGQFRRGRAADARRPGSARWSTE
jgi:hypothetical protein